MKGVEKEWLEGGVGSRLKVKRGKGGARNQKRARRREKEGDRRGELMKCKIDISASRFGSENLKENYRSKSLPENSASPW